MLTKFTCGVSHIDVFRTNLHGHQFHFRRSVCLVSANKGHLKIVTLRIRSLPTRRQPEGQSGLDRQQTNVSPLCAQ